MEGAAGNGPSAFASGGVSSDYKGGAVGTGQIAGTGPSADDRRKAQFYANNIRRLLKEELERHLETDAAQLEVTFAIWISPDGHLSRYELQPTGNAQVDADARRAFDEASKSMRLERPGDVVQPLRMKLVLLPNG
jgi:protein TonB